MLARIALAGVSLAVAAFLALEIAPARHVSQAQSLVTTGKAQRMSRSGRARVIARLDDASSLRPGTAAQQLAAGYALLNGDNAGALRFATAATRREPGNFAPWVTLALAQSRLGDTPAAERSLDRAIALNPRYPRPRLRAP